MDIELIYLMTKGCQQHREQKKKSKLSFTRDFSKSGACHSIPGAWMLCCCFMKQVLVLGFGNEIIQRYFRYLVVANKASLIHNRIWPLNV